MFFKMNEIRGDGNMKTKKLVITYEVPFDNENEEDVIRYCHELAEEAAMCEDFVRAELDGEELLIETYKSTT